MVVEQIEHEDEAVEENVEEVETESVDSNVAHKLPKMEEEEEAKEADTSMAAHKLSEMEPESEFLSLPTSLASHLLLPVEWPETGLPPSMVAHQIFHPCPENLNETVPLASSLDCEASNSLLSKQEADELNQTEGCVEELAENLRKDFEEWSKGVDFKATYYHLEEETILVEDSRETLLLMDLKDSMEISPPKAEPELVDTRENIGEEVSSLAAHRLLPPDEAESELIDTREDIGEEVSSLAAHGLLPPDET